MLCLGPSPERSSAEFQMERAVRNGGVSQRGGLGGEPGDWKHLSPPYTRMPNINHVPPLTHACVVYGNGTTPVGTLPGFLGDTLYLEASHLQSLFRWTLLDTYLGQIKLLCVQLERETMLGSFPELAVSTACTLASDQLNHR